MLDAGWSAIQYIYGFGSTPIVSTFGENAHPFMFWWLIRPLSDSSMWMSPKAVVPPNHPHHGWPWLRPWKGRTIKTYGGFLKWGYPKIIQFDRIFHDNPSSYGSKLSKKPKVAFGSAADLEIHLCTSKEGPGRGFICCVFHPSWGLP